MNIYSSDQYQIDAKFFQMRVYKYPINKWSNCLGIFIYSECITKLYIRKFSFDQFSY